ncbi:intracellular chloride channel [Aureococcus anophagefferens]|nr:intracellular chloride channel [Aureococcus anophagefferens]
MKDAEGFASVDYDLLDFVVHELHVERPSLSRAGAASRAGARLNEMIGIEAGDPPRPRPRGCYLPLAAAAVRDAAVVDYFPLVSALSLARLRERLPRRYVPFVREADHGAIRDVWGEHVALYFAFHSFQTRQLCFLAPTGLLCYGAATALKARGFYKFAAAIDVGFSIVVALWTIKFTRLWRRREAELALEFGTAGFTNKQRNRPQFAAHPGVVQRRSAFERARARGAAGRRAAGSIVAGAERGLMAVDSAFGRISEATTDYENHRTETAYEGSYVTKMFALKAITSYLASTSP